MTTREIKFRAWDKELKQMGNVLGMSFGEWVDLESGPGENDEEWRTRMKDVVLMQFTGLHDKNGKEIYEEDVVKYPFCTGELRQGTVEWASWGTGWEPFVICGKCGDVPQEDEVEVIGNIYENPELRNV